VSLQVIINGVILGALYACVGMGFSLVYGVLNISNLAHGALLMLGSYVTYWLFTLYGVDPFVSIIPAMVVLFIVGYVTQRLVINRVMGAESRTSLILTFGLQWLLINVALYIFKGDYRAVTPTYAGKGFNFGSLTLPYSRLGVLLIAIASAAGLQAFTTRTKVGNAIKAVALNRRGAELCGVDINHIYAVTFGIGAALAGLAGSVSTMAYVITPYIGQPLLGRAFVVTVLGGLGNVVGPLVGGLILGIAETSGAAILGTSYQEAISFIFLVLVLAIRPQGIFGRRFFGGA
jgi:branched-chain amino acid transport system permease protein